MNKPRVIAYTMESVAKVVHRATGAWPVTCPPFTDDTFPAELFQHADIIWLGLHGVADDPEHLFGDEVHLVSLPAPLRVRALDVRSLCGLDLAGKVVYATSCHLPDTAFPEAFKRCGATVVGGPGKNYGNTRRLTGADKLGMAFVRNLQSARSLTDALAQAKTILDATRSRADADAMEFGVL